MGHHHHFPAYMAFPTPVAITHTRLPPPCCLRVLRVSVVSSSFPDPYPRRARWKLSSERPTSDGDGPTRRKGEQILSIGNN